VWLGEARLGAVRHGVAGEDNYRKERTFNMTYQWKGPVVCKIDAQIAGEELERISQKGALTPKHVVDESRPGAAALHEHFDWNDETAAEKFRVVQARDILRGIVTVTVGGKKVAEPVRAFVSIQHRKYQQIARNGSY